MITSAWVRAMAAYNAEMNRRLYAAADTLDEPARRADGGAFFGGIHGTLSHIAWGDGMWMNRFDGWEKPAVSQAESPNFIPGWDALKTARIDMDQRLQAWAAALTQAGLAMDLTWFSGAAQCQMTRPLWLLISHMFNHQTHHRGQAHALITRAGGRTGATDLPWVIEAADWA